MAFLKINGKEYEAKTNFKFRKVADKKYTAESQGNEVDGFTNIYSNLLEEDIYYLAAFWDCALAHLDERPTREDIEDALNIAAGEEEDYTPLLQDAFKVLDKAGFFRGQVKNFWKNMEMMKNFGENENEKKAAEMQVNNLTETRKRLIGKKK